MKTAIVVGLLAMSWIAGAQQIPQGISTPAFLPVGFTGAPYSQTLLSGGPVPYGWQLTSGALPPGLTLSGAGVISGTPTTAGTSTFLVTLASPSSSQTFSLTIVAGPPHLVVTPPLLPAGSVGSIYPPFLANLAVSGGTPPYLWAVTSGALPSGLTSFYSYDVLGTPPSGVAVFPGTIAAAAVTSTFTVRVTDASSATVSQTCTLPITLVISPTNPNSSTIISLPSGVVGAAYSQTLAAAGGAGPPYTWSTTSALPAGLSLSTAGVLAGTPMAYGTWTLSIAVADAAATTSNRTFTLTISPAPLVITTASPLPSGSAGAAYSQTLTATGGVPPYVWQVTSGALPPLLTLNPAGAIGGTPTSPGVSVFTVSVADASLHYVSQTLTLSITLGPLTIGSPPSLPAGVAGAPYSQTLTATGGVPPYTWQVISGTWPAGLSISSAGAISGTPATAGTYVFTAQVRDSASATATRTFSLTVATAGALARAGVIAQVAAGGGWDTTIWLINRSSAPVQTRLALHGDDGNPLTLTLTVTQPGFSQQVAASTLDQVIAPNTTLVVATVAAASTVQAWVDVLGSGPLSGFAVFRYAGASEAAVPLQSQIGTSISLPFDNTGGYSTGVALVNLSGSPANITATVWDENGNQIVVQPVVLTKNDSAGNGHDSFMLPDRLAVTAGRRGIVQFQSNPAGPFTPAGALTGLGLRAGPNGVFTSIPTIVP